MTLFILWRWGGCRYINFHNPAKSADDSELTDDDVIIRYDGNEEIIGLTILHASKR